MSETPTPPKQKASNKRHIVIEVILSVLAAITLPTIALPFLFIPAAIAFPIVVSRRKLYFIPAAVACIALLILLFLFGVREFLSIMTLFLFIVAITGAFGVGAGLLIRHFLKSHKRMKIIAIAGGIVILLVPGLFILDAFIGLIRFPFANWRIRSYVARNYADFDLTVNRPYFDFKSGNFHALIQDSNNPDISFRITHRRGGEIHDRFTAGTFWAGTLDYMLTPLLEGEFSDEFHRVTPRIDGVQAGFTSQVSGVQVGQPFDKAADVEKTARIIVVTESADPETLAAKISRYHEFISQNGFNFERYRFHFRYENAPPVRRDERVIEITVISERINDDLPAMIEHARSNRDQNGVFRREYFRYNSRVDFTPADE